MRDQIGKFEILRLLGKGAMGEVYLGRDPLLGREVAVKVIQQDTSFAADALARFAREAQTAASLSHPNVVTIYEFGEDQGLFYLAMEFLQGKDLEGLIQSGARSKAELLESLLQVCEGLGYAHERGVIHRDIKPANIFVTSHGHRTTAKLMDFGIAQMGSTQLTEDGTWVGTVSYMAPEYLDTGKAAVSSDLFALGVVLYEVLSGGRRPFEGDSPTMVLNSILHKPPLPLESADLGGLSPRMLAVVDRALAKNPRERFPDAGALAAAIAEALSSESGEPAPPSGNGKPVEAAGSKAILQVGRGGTGRYLSLRVALRNAVPGSVIHVHPGCYRESLLVDKDVEIVGLGAAAEILVDGGKEAALVIRTPGAAIRGMSFRSDRQDGGPCAEVPNGAHLLEGCRFEGGQGACIRVGSAVQLQFRDCELKSSARLGIEVASAAQVHLEGCLLEGFQRAGLSLGPDSECRASGLRAGPAPGVGLLIAAGAQARLEDSEISGAESGGIEIEPGGSAELHRCRLIASRFAGVLALEQSKVSLTECELGDHAGAGIHLQPGAIVEVLRCRIAENQGYGVSILQGAQASLEGCEIRGNGFAGLRVHRGATAGLRQCRIIEGRGLGVECGEGGKATLESCEFCRNQGVGAQVAAGGDLSLSKCLLQDGRDAGLLLEEDSKAVLEECTFQGNAGGGIVLAPEAAEPLLRGVNRTKDDLFRLGPGGSRTRLTPPRQG